MISACGPRGRHSFWAFLPLSGTTRARLTDFFHCFVSSTFTFFLHLQSDRRLRRRNMTRRPLVIFTDAEAEYFYACARVRTQWSFFFFDDRDDKCLFTLSPRFRRLEYSEMFLPFSLPSNGLGWTEGWATPTPPFDLLSTSLCLLLTPCHSFIYHVVADPLFTPA